MGSEIVKSSFDEFSQMQEMAKALAPATILPAVLKQSPANLVVIMMTGAELGMSPMQAVRSIHLIEGKPTLSADAIAALCMRHRDVCEELTLVESTDTKATYRAKRAGASQPVTLSFTIEQAGKAGLAGRGNWAKYPAAMLRARCIAAICRAVFPDLVAGLYEADSEELGAAPIERDVTPAQAKGEAIDTTATVSAAREAVKAKRKLNVVDVAAPAPAPTPPPFVPDAETPALSAGPFVGWGKHAAVPLTQLTPDQLAWYLSTDGLDKCTKQVGVEIAEKLRAQYLDEAAARESQAVAP